MRTGEVELDGGETKHAQMMALKVYPLEVLHYRRRSGIEEEEEGLHPMAGGSLVRLTVPRP